MYNNNNSEARLVMTTNQSTSRRSKNISGFAFWEESTVGRSENKDINRHLMEWTLDIAFAAETSQYQQPTYRLGLTVTTKPIRTLDQLDERFRFADDTEATVRFQDESGKSRLMDIMMR